jgi:hypothetical protein
MKIRIQGATPLQITEIADVGAVVIYNDHDVPIVGAVMTGGGVWVETASDDDFHELQASLQRLGLIKDTVPERKIIVT